MKNTIKRITISGVDMPEISSENIQVCARALILACLQSGANEMIYTDKNFNHISGVKWGDWKVTIRQTKKP